jgi:hypothetical protein
MAEAGKRLCEAHRGATEKHLQIFRGLIEKKGSKTGTDHDFRSQLG